MSRTYALYQVDAFTKEKFFGNAAGVITNAMLLSDSEMQRIARELNNSETAFIFPPEDASHHVRIRYFTPTHEVPICGHATIAAHYARAVENNLESCRVMQKTGAGILPVDIIREGSDYQILMTQGSINFGDYITGKSLEMLFKALGISPADVRESHPVQIVSTGHSKVMLCLKNEVLLHQFSPDMGALSRLSGSIGCNGYYVFTQGRADAVPLVHGRMFAPAIGINEDPVTGNANGPLGAYLVRHGLVKHNGAVFDFYAVQGEAIHRAGNMQVHVAIHDNQPQQVRIKGCAVIAFSTELRIE